MKGGKEGGERQGRRMADAGGQEGGNESYRCLWRTLGTGVKVADLHRKAASLGVVRLMEMRP